MLEDDFLEILDPVLRAAGSVAEPGDDFRAPPLDVLRYYARPVRLHWVPFLGRATSVVAVARQPVDIGFSTADYLRFQARLAMAASGRFPPGRKGRGLVIGLTTVVLTPEPIGPNDDTVLGTVLVGLRRLRTVPLGILRLNLGQEALAFSLASSPDNLFPEAAALADALSLHFRRFVPLIAGD
jgi:hypothetical protein